MIIISIRMFLFIILILNEYKRFIAQATRKGRNVFHIVQYFNVKNNIQSNLNYVILTFYSTFYERKQCSPFQFQRQ